MPWPSLGPVPRQFQFRRWPSREIESGAGADGSGVRSTSRLSGRTMLISPSGTLLWCPILQLEYWYAMSCAGCMVFRQIPRRGLPVVRILLADRSRHFRRQGLQRNRCASHPRPTQEHCRPCRTGMRVPWCCQLGENTLPPYCPFCTLSLGHCRPCSPGRMSPPRFPMGR